MPIRLLLLAAMMLPLAACFSFGGGQSALPVSMTVSYDPSDANAAQEAADHCGQYGLKAVPAPADAKSGSVNFACR